MNSTIRTLLIVFLILIVIGAWPAWGWSNGFGYGWSGGAGGILLIVVLLILIGKL